MTDQPAQHQPAEHADNGGEPRFMRAFLPGLIVGLVVGLFIGAFGAPLIDRAGPVSRETGHRAPGGGVKPRSVHEQEVLPDGQRVGEPPAPSDNPENKKTDLPDQPAPPAPPPGGG
jgi:hypothetical protein